MPAEATRTIITTSTVTAAATPISRSFPTTIPWPDSPASRDRLRFSTPTAPELIQSMAAIEPAIRSGESRWVLQDQLHDLLVHVLRKALGQLLGHHLGLLVVAEHDGRQRGDPERQRDERGKEEPGEGRDLVRETGTPVEGDRFIDRAPEFVGPRHAA